MSTTMRLVDSTTSTELLSLSAYTETAGRLLSLDLGFPSVRSTTTFRTKGHGATDTSRYVGDRAITAVISLPSTPNDDAAADTLAGLLNPNLRLYMYVKRDGWVRERRTLVRGAAFTCPPGVNRQAQAGWVAPLGMFEDSVLQTVVLTPSGTGGGGMTFPVTFPMTFGTGVIPGFGMVTVGGTAPAYPIIDMYGPCSAPSLTLVNTGQTLSFPSLSIPAGSFVRVDVANLLVSLNGDPAQSQYSTFDFTVSQWWTLQPAVPNEIAFTVTSPGAGCEAVLSWRDTYI